MQTGTEIAATSQDQIDNAEMDDPIYNGIADNSTGYGLGNGSGIDVGGPGTGTASASQSAASQVAISASSSSSAAAAAANVVMSSGTFKYVGCQLDSSTSRTLSSLSWTGTGLTVERCASYCAKYQYMGVEFGSQ